jgi:uncharacterized membrane protein
MAARKHSSFFPFSRKGFELAASTIVVMILGIMIVAGGILLVAKLSSSGTHVADQITKEQQDALRKMLSDGQLVATYPSSQTIAAGKTQTYALTITNRLDGERTFSIDFPDHDPMVKILPIPDQKLEAGQQQELIIAVTPDRDIAPGKYPVIVKVSEGGAVYDSVRVFEVRVQ